jgi:hypothetical protein
LLIHLCLLSFCSYILTFKRRNVICFI